MLVHDVLSSDATSLPKSVGSSSGRWGFSGSSGNPDGKVGQAENLDVFLERGRYKTPGSSVFLKVDRNGNENFFLYFSRLNYSEKIDFGQLRCLVVSRLQYFVSIRNPPSWLQVLPFFFQDEFK